MLGSFPKANAFMSSWGSMNYLEGQSPTYRQIMARRAVPLVLENNAMFSNVLTGTPDPHFLPADAAALRENYIRFWGPIWLAGRELQANETRTVQIGVPGDYTVADGVIDIDGKRYRWDVEGILTQVSGHAWYHRGQIAQLVAALGGKAVDTDYILWCKLTPLDPPA